MLSRAKIKCFRVVLATLEKLGLQRAGGKLSTYVLGRWHRTVNSRQAGGEGPRPVVDQVTDEWGWWAGVTLRPHTHHPPLTRTSPPACLTGAAPRPRWNSKYGILFADLAEQQGLSLTFSLHGHKGKGPV